MFIQIYTILLFYKLQYFAKKTTKNKYIMIDLYKDMNKQIEEKREKTSKKISKEKIKAIKSTNREETQAEIQITN